MRIALAQIKNEGTIQDDLDKSIEFIRQASENIDVTDTMTVIWNIK